MTGQVGKWGNSLAVRLPKDIAEELDVKANDTVNFTIQKGKIVLEIVDKKPSFTLEELLNDYPETQEKEVDWGHAVGLEAW
ncbi:AbrB/MazE/SpoVT family DNA-binding domain-containing protein [Pleurocapsa sp. FMAR1]|uniref:AbrB/MazE/SpoVT family DNA-binding domain-containing protein n=1 Tax=Pleurocapsa sp. FMAR1 TaxID=3040204 RepID=UPI0029C8CD76|nr:AbrB/MazE/SpoVT family DNA-binding domain-containing protein [Pleurocapsa sp. FMAR1]